jgi:hypothetical protein
VAGLAPTSAATAIPGPASYLPHCGEGEILRSTSRVGNRQWSAWKHLADGCEHLAELVGERAVPGDVCTATWSTPRRGRQAPSVVSVTATTEGPYKTATWLQSVCQPG